MARAARLSGHEDEDPEYEELEAVLHSPRKVRCHTFMMRTHQLHLYTEAMLRRDLHGSTFSLSKCFLSCVCVCLHIVLCVQFVICVSLMNYASAGDGDVLCCRTH